MSLFILLLYRFDGLESVAEHDEFLPKKDGLPKKENRFTDVSTNALQHTAITNNKPNKPLTI